MAKSGAPKNGSSISFLVNVQTSDMLFITMPNRSIGLPTGGKKFDPFGSAELETSDYGRLTASPRLPFKTQLSGEMMPVRIAEQIRADVQEARTVAPISVSILDERRNIWAALIESFKFEMERGINYAQYRFDLLITAMPATYGKVCN